MDIKAIMDAYNDMLMALRAVNGDHTYITPGGHENCRFCDNNMDHEGTYLDMHSSDCVIHKVRAALVKAQGVAS